MRKRLLLAVYEEQAFVLRAALLPFLTWFLAIQSNMQGDRKGLPIHIKIKIAVFVIMTERRGSMTGASPVTTICGLAWQSHAVADSYSSDRACPCHASDDLLLVQSNLNHSYLDAYGETLAVSLHFTVVLMGRYALC